MSKSYSTIPPDGPHAVHLQHAIMAFTEVPGLIGVFWRSSGNPDGDALALANVSRFLVSEMLLPTNKFKLCKVIGDFANQQLCPDHEKFAEQLLDQRLLTLRSVYDPNVYNLDALACHPCADARLGHCDIASRAPGTHCTNCILWRQNSCNCVGSPIMTLMESLVTRAARFGGKIAPPKDFTALAASDQQQHTMDFCKRNFGTDFEWPPPQPPSPEMPKTIQNNALDFAGGDMRGRALLLEQQKQAKRKADATPYGKAQRDDQDLETAPSGNAATAESRGSKKRATEVRIIIEGAANETVESVLVSSSQADRSTAMEDPLQTMGPSTPVVVVVKVELVRSVSPSQE